MKREDDFEKKREHLKNLSDKELYERFWCLAEQIVKPMVDLAYSNTSPAVERSVLLRMGFSSLEAADIVKNGVKWDLLGKGMGNVVLTYSKIKKIDYLKAGGQLANGIGWNELIEKFAQKTD